MKYDREYINQLMDAYSNLLTKHQKEILSEYFEEDLSMIEISENYNISKAAVSDIINRCISQLNNFEEKLSVVERNNQISSIIEEMRNKNIDILNEYAEKLENIDKEK